MTSSPRLIGARFEILESLSRSGPFETFRGVDKESGAGCVIKQLSASPARAGDGELVVLSGDEASALRAFLVDEANLLSHLEHPGVPRFCALVDEGATVSFVREHVEGKTLAQLIDEGKPFAEREALAVLASLAETLEHLHGLSPPVIHRNLRPSNVVVTANGRARLIDFGAARATLTRGRDAAVFLGSSYSAPEERDGTATPRSDLYALGATMLHALSHEPPGAHPLSTSTLNVSPALRALLAKLLDPDPARRIGRASELRARLERLGQSEGERLQGSRPLLTIGLSVALLAVGVVIFLAGGRRDAIEPTASSASSSTSTSTSTSTSSAHEQLSPATKPDVRALKRSYAANEPITVEFAVPRASATDWITVVPAAAPHTTYRQWRYTERATAGSMSFDALAPGAYEARLYLDWPRGGYVVAARAAFHVDDEAPAAEGDARGDSELVVNDPAVTWASEVVELSSEYDRPRWSAERALGRPDVFPSHGDIDRAWATRASDAGIEHITVAFPATLAREVIVVETFNPGAVVRVDDVSDAEPVTLWRAPQGLAAAASSSRVLRVAVPVARRITRLKVTLDTRLVHGWNEIDAIGLARSGP